MKYDMDLDQLITYFSNSPIGTYVVQDQCFCFTNTKFQDIIGYPEQLLLKTNPLDLVVDEDREMLRHNAVSMLKNERSEPYEFRVKTRKGKVRWIIESLVSITYHGKRAVMGHFMDVTENKQAQIALKSSEQRYRSIFELAREGILIIDYADGSIIDGNLELKKISGYESRDLKQMKIWEFQPPDFQYEAEQSFFRFKEKSGGLVSAKLIQNKSGKMIPVEILAQRILMDGKEVIICMVRDTTEREAMIRALTTASEEWRKTFDALDDAILLIGSDFTIQRANLATARLVDMNINKLVGLPCYSVIHNLDYPPDFCPHLKTQKSGIYCETEKAEPHLNKILNFCAAPIKDQKGEVSHIVEIISDKTTHRHSEEQSVKLSEDLANSFTGITEALSGLVENRDPYTAGHSKHVAELALKVGKEMGLNSEELEGLKVCALLHDIGKASIPAGVLNKPGKLSEHEWGFIREHPTTAYETLLRIPFPWPVADVVYQHHERLDGSGYPQGLKGDQIHLWAQIISVADIYDAMTSHRPYRPGLPLEETMEELMAGTNSRYDNSIIAAMSRILALENKKIIIVDHNVDIIEELSAELKHNGFEPSGHTSPENVLTSLENKSVPLIITELDIPGRINGIQLTRKVKNLYPETEVIIMANINSKEGSLSALRAGASDFLEKPLNITMFNKTVNRALQRYSARKYR